MTAGQTKRLIAAILLLAVLLRIAVATVHPFWFPDSADYDALGRAVAHALPYQVNGLVATRMPGYPLFLGAIYAIVGPSVLTILILQALMGGASTWLVYLLGQRISQPVALLAALLAAIDPLSIGFSAALLSETAFTLLLLTALWLVAKWRDTGLFMWCMLFALAWGAAVYMRASALWCMVPLVLWCVMTPRGQSKIGQRILSAILACTIVLLSLLPWQLRNYSLFHESFGRLTTLEGISLYEAVYPGADGSPKQDLLPTPPDMLTLNESQRNNEYSHRAWHYIFSDPARIARLALQKIARTWSPAFNAAGFQNPAIQLAMLLWHIPLFLLALLGLARNTFPTSLKILLLLPILYFTTLHALFLGSVRYRVPLMPLLCLFAASGLLKLTQRPTLPNPAPHKKT
jgi:4-amino-4-deoxy-L-arabinose transferase-like glycosyltransferase